MLEWLYLQSDKVGFRANNIATDKEGRYITMKGWIQQEDVTILNIYVPDSKASQIRKAKTDRTAKKNRQIHHYNQGCQTSFSIIVGTSRQKTSKDVEDSNHTLNQADLRDIYTHCSNHKAHILFKYAKDMGQNGPYSRPQNKFQYS